MNTPALKKAVIFGIAAVVFGLLSKFVVHPLFSVTLPDVCKSWNEKHVMEVSLFVTGFFLGLFANFFSFI